jgi:septum formation protein
MTLILASASPRRADLLRAAGFAFEVKPAHVDERVTAGETPAAYVARLAAEKAEAVAAQAPGRVVLAADTTVVIDEAILGKPEDARSAGAMLRRLSGRTHEVLTGVCLVAGRAGGPAPVQALVARTSVTFAALGPAEIDWYVGTGEPMDKAGGYAIQGLGSRFVTEVCGSYTNVVGLPVAEVHGLCRAAGILVS